MTGNHNENDATQNLPDPKGSENDKCCEILEKIDIYSNFMWDLLNRMACKNGKIPDDLDNISITSSLEDANAKIQSDLNVVRDCLDNRKQTELHAIDLLSEGIGMTLNLQTIKH